VRLTQHAYRGPPKQDQAGLSEGLATDLGLGTVAAIEFVPVIGLAALTARTKRNGVALLLGVTGVDLLTDVRLAAEPVGVGFAVANAMLFALYIVLGHHVAHSVT